jgi:hypothetical protein
MLNPTNLSRPPRKGFPRGNKAVIPAEAGIQL